VTQTPSPKPKKPFSHPEKPSGKVSFLTNLDSDSLRPGAAGSLRFSLQPVLISSTDFAVLTESTDSTASNISGKSLLTIILSFTLNRATFEWCG
jgi:hypothetical protein